MPKPGFIPLLLVVGALLAGCTLAGTPTASPIPITATPEHGTPAGPPLTPAVLSILRSDYGPFTDAAWVLDGICFEALARMNGESWTWDTAETLDRFFDRVDESDLCSAPVQRAAFDFTDQILVGVVHTMQGCDAAHRLIDVAQDDAAQTRTLVLALEVRPGCPYELVQLFLAAVPRLTAPYTTAIRLEAP